MEYYFSKENLQSDAYLLSMMDANKSVLIGVVMGFAKLKALTQDESLVEKALESSKVVSVADGRIKAILKSGGRTTLILRDIQSDASEEEVREIFNFEGCKPILSLRSDIGNTWFVVMENEEDAKLTLEDLKSKKRLFRSQPVKGRVKSETLFRSFHTTVSPPPNMAMSPLGMYAGGPGMPFPPYMGPPGAPVVPLAYGYIGSASASGIMPGSSGNPQITDVDLSVSVMPKGGKDQISSSSKAATYASSVSASLQTSGKLDNRRNQHLSTGSNASSGPQNAASSSNRTGSAQGVSPRAQKEQKAGANSSNSGDRRSGPQSASDKEGGAHSGTQGSNRDNRDRKNTRGNKDDGTAASNSNTVKGHFENSLANFPPLPHSDEPVATPGYKGSFIKYSYDDIMHIVKNVSDATLSDTIIPTDHPLVMEKTPNMGLLSRQRTFSIEQTREQLKQGRPVNKEAVTGNGAVDYGSMMYGEGFVSEKDGPASVSEGDKAPGAGTKKSNSTSTSTGGGAGGGAKKSAPDSSATGHVYTSPASQVALPEPSAPKAGTWAGILLNGNMGPPVDATGKPLPVQRKPSSDKEKPGPVSPGAVGSGSGPNSPDRKDKSADEKKAKKGGADKDKVEEGNGSKKGKGGMGDGNRRTGKDGSSKVSFVARGTIF